MVAPCFECLNEHDIYTGEPKHKYNEWRDERLSWEEIQKQDREFYEELDRLFLPNEKSSDLRP